ncbi:O-antigen ligase family protein [Sphingomonas sp.]|uniref:O-antigen ligase family protein n=1 Tax=Sphingomonas sp. TaxID=28214 RepID=UPI002D802888|nr:O-antigen ligase family protein [Sphingomonas sp.]HEU0042950.1 O-antigen ligase family protein [Sphingomonas sp.]
MDLYGWLGIAIGVVMPVLSAMIYPTYMHQMYPAWAEWTRLMELPFVACEIVIIQAAVRAGYRDGEILGKLPKDITAALALLTIGLIVGSTFSSKNVAASLALSITTVVHLRLCAAIFFLARPVQPERLSAFFPWLGAGLVALTLLTIWKFQLPPPEWTVPGGTIEWASAMPGFISVRHFGSWTGAIAAGLMIAMLYGKREESRLGDLLYLLAAGLTFWSGTRAAVLAMAVVALIAWASLRRLPDARAIVRVGSLSALAMLGAIMFDPGLAEFTLFGRSDVHDASALASGRLELWHDTFMRWRDAPVFGWGSGSTFWEVYTGWSHTQPHNVVLQFLISWGLVGAAGGLWLLGRAIGATHRTGMKDDALRPLTGTLYALLIMSLLEGMLYYPRFIMLVMIGFGVLFAARERANVPLVRQSRAT